MPSSDHCETPREAYADVAPIISAIAGMLTPAKTDDSVVIYDPYYCAGSMKQHLEQLGFPNVINRNTDFYADIRNNTIPEYDILITNPPYSTDSYNHIKRLMQFLANQKKPFFILQPVYVYTKPYFKAAREQLGEGVFFITPSHRYRFHTPHGMRDVRNQHLATSPFVSLWYCYVPSSLFPALRRWWCTEGHRLCEGCLMRAQTRNLPQKFKDSHDQTRHRKRLKQRRSHRRRHLRMERERQQQERAQSKGADARSSGGNGEIPTASKAKGERMGGRGVGRARGGGAVCGAQAVVPPLRSRGRGRGRGKDRARGTGRGRGGGGRGRGGSRDAAGRRRALQRW